MTDDTGPAYTLKDLCIDAASPAAAARFWSSALGLRAEPVETGFVLRGDRPEHTIWVNQVPEPKVAKHRVHLDVYTSGIDDLVARGASVLEVMERWTVMADPEGGEFCAFVRAEADLPAYRLLELVVDSCDPEPIATWWAERLGARPQSSPEGWWWLEGARGMPWEIVFNRVPEPKTAKNRVHWDVVGDSAALVAAGATLQRSRGDGIRWDVLTDPDGNEFCVFLPDPQD